MKPNAKWILKDTTSKAKEKDRDKVVVETHDVRTVGSARVATLTWTHVTRSDKSPLDQCGFGLRRDGIVSADHPGLYFVGHNYDVRCAIFNIRRDARRAARRLTSEIGGTSRTSTGTRPQPNER